MYRTVIFDMDGTILDTLSDLTDSLNHALTVFEMPQRTTEEVRRFLGNGIRALVECAVPAGTPIAKTDEVFSFFAAYYPKHCQIRTAPYTGIVPLLQTLKEHGVQTAVVSNKVDSAVQILCDTYFAGLFDYAVGEKEGIHKKPSPEGVLHIMETLHAQTAQTVYIGDTEVDAQTAQNAGIDCVLVSWGFRDPCQLEQLPAKYRVSTTAALQQILLPT